MIPSLAKFLTEVVRFIDLTQELSKPKNDKGRLKLFWDGLRFLGQRLRLARFPGKQSAKVALTHTAPPH